MKDHENIVDAAKKEINKSNAATTYAFISERNRPLITFVLLAYNQERFIREAIEGAFSQTYTPLEIILSDDCSTDQTFEIMKRMASEYEGSHTIIINHNEVNNGLSNHFNRIIEQSHGEIIICAAGDDISLPDRTKLSWEILHNYPAASCVSLRTENIDAEGRLIQTKNNVETKPFLKEYTIEDYLAIPCFHLNGASRAFRKSVHTTFGHLDPICGAEDSTTLLRCLMLGSAFACSEIGVYYRVHGNNLSIGRNVNSIKHENIFGQWIKDIQHAYSLGMLSDSLTEQLKKQFRKNLARRCLEADIVQSKFNVIFALSRIMLSDSFTIKEKLYIIYNKLRNILSN